MLLCATSPLLPSLKTRTETFALCAPSCVALALASARWVGVQVALAVAFASELFTWVTAPLSPPLETRTEAFVLLAPVCIDVAVACTSRPLPLHCPAAPL